MEVANTSGSRNPNSKLDADTARKVFLSKDKAAVTAKAYGISEGLVCAIWRGYRWGHATKHLTRPTKEKGKPAALKPKSSNSYAARPGGFSNRVRPIDFVRKSVRCQCGSKVEFLHEEHGVCLSCCVRNKLIYERSFDDATDFGDSGMTEEKIAARIQTADRIRQFVGPNDSILELLKGATRDETGCS